MCGQSAFRPTTAPITPTKRELWSDGAKSHPMVCQLLLCNKWNCPSSTIASVSGGTSRWASSSQSGSINRKLSLASSQIIYMIVIIRSTQFCAGLEEGGKDACQGDSGSPMMKMDKTSGQAMAIGIVSAGIGCALPKLPGLYTRISAFIPWIKNSINVQDKPILPPQVPSFPPHVPTVPAKLPALPEVHPTHNTSRPIITIPANTNNVISVIFNLTQPHHHPSPSKVPTLPPLTTSPPIAVLFNTTNN